MTLRVLVCLLIAFTLHACGSEVQKTAGAGRTGQIASVSPELKPSPKATAPKPAPQAEATPAPSFSAEEQDPSRLLDLHESDLAAILGQPNFVRKDMSAEVWQYRTDACVLDLFLYEFDQGRAVTYYEFRARSDGETVHNDCFVTLLRRGASQAAQN